MTTNTRVVAAHADQPNGVGRLQILRTNRFHHISTGEVFGSLGPTGRFSETTPYYPRSLYSARKAASDHLVNAWHHTYGLWQFPEKLIPGNGLNVRDWLYVEDHVDALLRRLAGGAGGGITNAGKE